VTDGETNASIPRGTDPKTMTLEAARELIEARASAPPREKRGGRFGGKSRAPRAAARTSPAFEAASAPAAKRRKAPAPAAKTSKAKVRPRKTVH